MTHDEIREHVRQAALELARGMLDRANTVSPEAKAETDEPVAEAERAESPDETNADLTYEEVVELASGYVQEDEERMLSTGALRRPLTHTERIRVVHETQDSVEESEHGILVSDPETIIRRVFWYTIRPKTRPRPPVVVVPRRPVGLARTPRVRRVVRRAAVSTRAGPDEPSRPPDRLTRPGDPGAGIRVPAFTRGLFARGPPSGARDGAHSGSQSRWRFEK